MGNLKLVYSFFLFFIYFSCSSCSSFSGIHKCPDEQRDALLVFSQNISSIDDLYYYDSYVNNNMDEYCKAMYGRSRYDPVKMNWNTRIDCCDWIGITCNNFTGDVISLNLGCRLLQGVLELDILLSSLPKLEAIDLSNSGFSIVTKNDAQYVNPSLYELRLAYCNLTAFPDFLRAMKNLQILDISSNSLSGQVPAWLGGIGGNNLTYLDLSDNFITGLPEFRSDRLKYLYLQSNQIQGPFPPWICDKKRLKYLDISENKISGMVPQCLQNINSSLVSLNVKSNMIQGQFPTVICNMDNMLYLDLSNNSFSGVIPQCFGNITSSLAMINLAENKFHGTIPKVFGSCELVDGLVLRGNHLEGEVPRSLAKCQSLKVLDLGYNQLNGTFPRWLGDLPKLQVLILKSNNLQGTIETPAATEFLFPSLWIFDISSNGFVGRLPEKYFESFNAIKDADKSHKTELVNISGLHSNYSINVPVKGLPLATSLVIPYFTYIDLSSNRFEGDIPNAIGNLISLVALNLSNNNLNGHIPHALGNILAMEALDLSRNQLTGEIPQILTNLVDLSLLNLSQNHLTGRIPMGKQFNTFGDSTFYGNPGLCRFPLSRDCEDLSSPEVEAEPEGEKWICLEAVMLGLGGGTILGVLWGYRMLSTGRPKWLNVIADAGGHTRRKKRKRVHIRNRN